ncbi:MAG TPA: hypothetical protein VKA37_13855 [Halobacteriales archaeon]|nr:hypothetical protein [Halobacteriales archaeon]
MAGNAQADLAAVDIHDVLSNERRRMVLSILHEEDTRSTTARDLSERIAEMETGQSPPPRNIRQSAYVSLHQTHLPKLDELGIIDYDESAKTVTLTDRARQVSVYMETVPRYGISWSEYYLGVSAIGLLLVFAAWTGVPVIGSVGAATWATLVLALILVSGTYQTIQQGSSIIHRIREGDEAAD